MSEPLAVCGCAESPRRSAVSVLCVSGMGCRWRPSRKVEVIRLGGKAIFKTKFSHCTPPTTATMPGQDTQKRAEKLDVESDADRQQRLGKLVGEGTERN